MFKRGFVILGVVSLTMGNSPRTPRYRDRRNLPPEREIPAPECHSDPYPPCAGRLYPLQCQRGCRTAFYKEQRPQIFTGTEPEGQEGI